MWVFSRVLSLFHELFDHGNVDLGLAAALGKSQTGCSNSNTSAVGKVDECTAVE